MNMINKLEAYAKMRTSSGKVFTATFIKKDGTVRNLNGRIGVKKGVTGKGMRYKPLQKLLLPVYDMQKKAFRMINLDTMEHLKINGQEYMVI